jgi:hypothetical protein
MGDLLPSGLAEHVGTDEDLARLLKSSSHFTATAVKGAAFMPAKDAATSVIRHAAVPRDELIQLAYGFIGTTASLHGIAMCKAGAVRAEHLEVIADEPPPRHANIVGWPMNPDPDLQKAQQKERALALAAHATLIRM